MEPNKIQVRPLPIEKWHKLSGKDSFAGKFTITPLIDDSTGMYKTGMTSEELEKYGKILGQDLTPRYDSQKPHYFWDSEAAAIKLENRTNFIDKTDPIGFINYKTLVGSKYIANNMKEWEEGLWPDAVFVIVDEETDSDIKASKIAIIKSAILETAKLSKDRKAAIVLILSGKLVRGKSDNFVEVALDEEINKNPAEVLRLAKLDKGQMATQALVLEAIQRGALQKAGHRIMYMDSIIGEDIYSAADYLEDPKNQELKLRIQTTLNS